MASQAAIAIQNATMHESLLERERLDRDLKLAEQVQKRFLPQSVPDDPRLRVLRPLRAGLRGRRRLLRLRAAARQPLAVAVGDVSGKGVAAALMMAKFSGDTRYCILTENSPAAAASELNHLLFAAGIEEKFITLSLSVLDVERRTPDAELGRASADPGPPGRRQGRGGRRGDRRASRWGSSRARSTSRPRSRSNTGDVVVVYSDGVTDARNLREELYDSRENRRLLRRLAETSGRAGGRRPGHPPGHPRILRRPRPGRRHHPGLLRAGRGRP